MTPVRPRRAGTPLGVFTHGSGHLTQDASGGVEACDRPRLGYDAGLAAIARGEHHAYVIGFVAGKAERTGAELVDRLAADPPPVRGSSDELEQVLLNPVINAIDATPRGGAVTLASRWEGVALSDGSPAVELSVADTGCGMDVATQARAYEPFFTTKGGSGTGLGLSICYGFVTAHGGELQLESTPDEGNVFRLLFPIDPGATPPPRSRPAPREG